MKDDIQKNEVRKLEVAQNAENMVLKKDQALQLT